MGNTRCHVKASFRRQPRCGKSVVLHGDVLAHQQQQCQKARHRKKLLLTIRAVMIKEHVDLVAGTSTGPLGAANAVTDVSVLSKKLSPTQIYRCHLAPHRCGVQVQY